MGSNITTENFIERSKVIHNNKYDYSEVVYVNTVEKVKIFCPEHGFFYQSPNSHLQGKKCAKCAFEQRGIKNRNIIKEKYLKDKKVESLLEKQHGNKYKLISLETFENYKSKIELNCKQHGNFFIAIRQIVRGYGCPECYKEEVRLKRQENFIKRANKIHDNFFDYHEVFYIRPHDKVKIICPLHGAFLQVANCHISGSGCPVCKTSKLERETEKWLKHNNIKYKKQKKFSKCRNIFELPFDFFLPEYSICIECDGKQHSSIESYYEFMDGRGSRKSKETLKEEFFT
jgi:hypothetical protein